MNIARPLKFAAFTLLAVSVLWACGGASGPKAIGEKFLQAMASGDLESAKQYATHESHPSIDLMKATADEKKAKPDQIEIGDVTEEGDKATLNYKENGIEKTLSLTKVGKDWKVSWSKGQSSDVGDELDQSSDDLIKAMDDAHAAADTTNRDTTPGQ
jgi:hypothetical protein